MAAVAERCIWRWGAPPPLPSLPERNSEKVVVLG
jgi:hypothetical protein